MKTEIEITHKIKGYLVGNIWMPQTECYKPLDYDLTREDARFSDSDGKKRVGSLWDHCSRACNDGDFQFCAIADGVLETTASIKRGGKIYTRRVYRELAQFPSITDLIKQDWNGPICED